MISTLQQTLEQFWIANIQPQMITINTFFDNQEGAGSDLNGWCRHTILENNRQFSALGRKNLRVDGIVAVQVFTKKGAGSQQSNLIGDILYRGYTGNCAGSVRFGAVTKQPSIISGGWYQTTYFIEFYSDEQIQ
jgi:hypothetical protein